MVTLRFALSSELNVAPDVVLATLNIEGVNAELWPLVRMTAPAAWARLPLAQWPAQRQLFQSWILFLGVLPVDRHAFYLQEVIPGHGFVERSSSTVNALWRHERRIVATAGGCRVTDTVEYRSRVALLGCLLKPVYQLVFWNRHRTLRSRYGRLADT